MRDIRGFKRRNRNQTFLHGLMDYAKTLKLRFWLGDLDLPKRRKRRKRYTSSREEEQDVQMCLCGKAIWNRTQIVGECEMR